MSQSEFNFDTPPKKDASEIPGSLLDKIKKLLRLSASSNPHEAALAMSRAMAMADRANLDLSTLREDDEVGEIIERWIPVGSRLARERQLALGIVATYFNVNPVMYHRRAQVVFIGTASDIAIAEYAFEFLTNISRRCLKAFETGEKAARRKTGGAKRANFYAGFFYGVAGQLRRQRQEILLEDQKFALVLADQAQARGEYSTTLGQTKEVTIGKVRRDRTALERGFIDGRNTSINPALPANGRQLALT